MTPSEFTTYLNSLPYDKFCQDIECINWVGHSRSHVTWDLMKDMFDWKDKSVVDLGGFHGYYCFKIEQAGAQHVACFDKSTAVLNTTGIIREMSNSSICLHEWSMGEPVSSSYDIALLISVLYFAKDREEVIKNIHCKYLLCDVGDDDLEVINKYYIVRQHKVSWGKEVRNGIGNLMLCERKNYV